MPTLSTETTNADAIGVFQDDDKVRALRAHYEAVGYRAQGTRAILLWTTWTGSRPSRGFLVVLDLARGGKVERQEAMIAATVSFEGGQPRQLQILEGRGLQAVSRWLR